MIVIEGFTSESMARLEAALKEKNIEYLAAAQRGFLRAGKEFIAKIQKEQLSKPGSSGKDNRMTERRFRRRLGSYYVVQNSGAVRDMGLHVRTGNLRRSWFAESTLQSEGDLRGRVFTDAKYARIHQTGGYAGRGHRAYIPKRLTIWEEWEKSGKFYYAQAVIAALKEYKK